MTRTLTFLTMLLCIMLIGCHTAPKENDTSEAITPISTYAYQCSPAIEFVARLADKDHIWLFLPQETVKLPRVKSGSGVKYQLANIMFWQHQDEAMLSLRDILYKACKNNPSEAIWQAAKLNGADFRSVGNEPGWHLTINQKANITLTTQYGQQIEHFSHAAILSSATHTLYQAKNGSNTLLMKLSIGPCTDSMSGEKFETHVSLKVNEQSLKGCGKSLN